MNESLIHEVCKIFEGRSSEEQFEVLQAMLAGMHNKVRNAEYRANKIESMAVSLFYLACRPNSSKKAVKKEWEIVQSIIKELEGKTDKNWTGLLEWKSKHA